MWVLVLGLGMLPSCTNVPPAPVLMWVYQDGPLHLDLSSVAIAATDATQVRVFWEFKPPDEARLRQLGLYRTTEFVRLTLVAASPQAPNWRGFEVRDGDALVNHLVQPEDDYARTGGNPAMLQAGRQLASRYKDQSANSHLNLYFITFTYPSELLVDREPGVLTISHRLKPIGATYASARFVVGEGTAGGAGKPELVASVDNPFYTVDLKITEVAPGREILTRTYRRNWVYLVPILLLIGLSCLLSHRNRQ